MNKVWIQKLTPKSLRIIELCIRAGIGTDDPVIPLFLMRNKK